MGSFFCHLGVDISSTVGYSVLNINQKEELMVHQDLKPLSEYSTRQLKQILDSARACGGSYQPYDYGPAYEFSDIKAEMDTREHIPNKKEAKALRREAAKRGR